MPPVGYVTLISALLCVLSPLESSKLDPHEESPNEPVFSSSASILTKGSPPTTTLAPPFAMLAPPFATLPSRDVPGALVLSATSSHTAAGLSGDSEMHQLVNNHEWSKTPLGPIHSWSWSIKSTVRTLLASRYPMILLWGKELTQIYNAPLPWAARETMNKTIREAQKATLEAAGFSATTVDSVHEECTFGVRTKQELFGEFSKVKEIVASLQTMKSLRPPKGFSTPGMRSGPDAIYAKAYPSKEERNSHEEDSHHTRGFRSNAHSGYHGRPRGQGYRGRGGGSCSGDRDGSSNHHQNNSNDSKRYGTECGFIDK
ncbi:uncharacterized protein EV422DRAFT_568250 [Fimicolochytrium jonesii]|uniref:uncharacterized protein n=1 Tax=Fimicolochytrium jonesii TaxID=1396493 RepID=UPI0022FEBAB5|nr:uncharacterized protein EV422DRAFT_568250 [Fimicolochytrium jonesii]KAI8820285.1 hypothetical protein EV422DRAFT_568250 [Fimicolochytrium jonesii]